MFIYGPLDSPTIALWRDVNIEVHTTTEHQVLLRQPGHFKCGFPYANDVRFLVQDLPVAALPKYQSCGESMRREAQVR